MTAATNITSIADKLAAYDADPAPKTEIETLNRPEVIRLSDVEPKSIEWLWPGWLPKGMLTILGGYAGDGKSTITLALAAALSNGAPLPDGTVAPITNSLLLLAEDDIPRVVAPRLAEHNADRDRIQAYSGKYRDGRPLSLNVKANVLELRQDILENDIGLLVIDPISSFMPAGADRNNEGEVRESLGPLLQMAEETGVAILGIMHVGKSEGYSRSTQRLMGSSAFVAVARSVWMLAPLPKDKQVEGEQERKVLGVEKSNYARPPKALVYSRDQDAAVQFHGESAMTLSEVLSWKKPAAEREKGSVERDKAKEFLYRFLAGGMKRPHEVEAAGEKEGHTKRILRRASEEMGLAHKRIGKEWYWSLPLD